MSNLSERREVERGELRQHAMNSMDWTLASLGRDPGGCPGPVGPGIMPPVLLFYLFSIYMCI
jgi:hypothetical protein